MALSVENERLTVTEFRELQKFEKLEDALKFWASQRDPVPFNWWQKVYNQLRRVYLPRDAALVKDSLPPSWGLAFGKHGFSQRRAQP